MRFVVATAVIGLTFGLVLKFVAGGEPVGATMFVALVVLPLMGFLVTIDDDLPGGFSSPMPSTVFARPSRFESSMPTTRLPSSERSPVSPQ